MQMGFSFVCPTELEEADVPFFEQKLRFFLVSSLLFRALFTLSQGITVLDFAWKFFFTRRFLSRVKEIKMCLFRNKEDSLEVKLPLD